VAEPSGSVVPVWERMTGERAGAFEAADIYFKLRSARSLAAVAAKTGKGLSQIEKWSVQRNWVDRATAYDDHLAEIANRAIEKQVSETAAKWSRRAEEQAEEEYQLARGSHRTAVPSAPTACHLSREVHIVAPKA
jgi:hypothetical protein